jgi:hypothetical protein
LAYDRKQGGHQVAQANRPDYRLEVGHAAVEVGAAREFSVLDTTQAATLKAWVATLIPAASGRPDAAEVGAAEYVDATVALVPSLRSVLIAGLTALAEIAAAKAGRDFTSCDANERELLLRELEAGDESDAFNMVRDFTYEAYYGHPRVLGALERDRGWSSSSPTRGSAMPPFDDSRLARVMTLPPLWRKA